MSRLKLKFAAMVGSVAVLALLGISTDAEAARKKPVARNSVHHTQSVRSSFGQVPRTVYGNVTPYGRAAPGTDILGGGPSAGWGGPP